MNVHFRLTGCLKANARGIFPFWEDKMVLCSYYRGHMEDQPQRLQAMCDTVLGLTDVVVIPRWLQSRGRHKITFMIPQRDWRNLAISPSPSSVSYLAAMYQSNHALEMEKTAAGFKLVTPLNPRVFEVRIGLSESLLVICIASPHRDWLETGIETVRSTLFPPQVSRLRLWAA